MGWRDAGALQDLPWDPTVLAWPHPPNLDTPLLVAPPSPVWTLRFLLVCKSKPKPAATPAEPPPAAAPPQPPAHFAKALGAISPALDRQGTVC